MARRIVLTMLCLVGALLVTAVIPLGLLTTARERSTFREETLLSAQAFAAVAEDGLTNHTGGQAMASFLRQLALLSAQFCRLGLKRPGGYESCGLRWKDAVYS